jgi:CysZ protein
MNTASKPKNNPVTGFNYLVRGLGMLTRPELRPFVIVPLLVNILVFSLMIWGGVILYEQLINQFLPESDWLVVLRLLLWLIFVIGGGLIIFYTFTVVANLIAAPFNGLLAEKTEALLTGQAPSAPGGGIIKDLVPSILSELRKLSYFIFWAVLLLILLFIPVIGIVAPFLWLAFNAWFMALEYADFPMGNSGLKFKEELNIMKRIRLTNLGFGGGVTVMMAVPPLSFVAMPAAVIGATIMWCEQRDTLLQCAPPRDQ